VQHYRGVVLVGVFVYNDTHIVTIIPTCSKCAIDSIHQHFSPPLYIFIFPADFDTEFDGYSADGDGGFQDIYGTGNKKPRADRSTPWDARTTNCALADPSG